MPISRQYILLLFAFALSSISLAQQTKVRGTVIDKNTKEVIPFAPIVFKNTTIGTTTDENGEYTLSSEKAFDSISISNVGYKKQTLFIKRNTSQRIDIALESDNYNLHEVIIKPGRNPAFRILDNVVANKSKNKNTSLSSYEWEEYEKFQIYFGNYSKKFTDRKQFNNYKFIFDYADSTKDGKAMLPIYMSENIKEKYVIDKPELNKEITLASKSTGETYEQLTTIANRMVENINVYDNFFLILDKSFISPINDNYQLYYKYYLEDSLLIDNQKCYKIRFVPKWKEDLAFSGNMYIHDSTWAVKKIDIQINNEINLNYVKDFWVKQEFTYTNNKWIQKKFETSATISPIKRKQSEEFTVHRTTSFKDFIINEPEKINSNYFAQSKSNEEISLTKSEDYWKSARHDSLSNKEKYNYLIADTINYVPAIKKVKKAFIVFASGYVELGQISLGQIHTFYSYNPIEQDRYKLGLKTNKYFSKKVQYEGYVAYGSSDQLFKYAYKILYVPINGDKRLALGCTNKKDLDQLGISSNHIQFDNILTSITKTSEINRLTFNDESSIFIEKNWSSGLSNKLSFNVTSIKPLGDLSFQKQLDTAANVRQLFDKISTTEIHLNTRLSFGEKFITTEFKRSSLGSRFPIINLDLTFGIKGLLNAQYDYQKVQLNLKGKLRFNPIGYTQYNLEGGKIFGNTPYIFAEMHPGNQTLVYDDQAFNLMKYFEFASDEYVSLHLDHHFEGFFLNKIPLIKKAQLREVISARGVVGNLHDNVKSEMILPLGMSDVSKPYVECSVGLENIFKVVRIDYIWRVTDKSAISSENWSIKAKFYFSF